MCVFNSLFCFHPSPEGARPYQIKNEVQRVNLRDKTLKLHFL